MKIISSFVLLIAINCQLNGQKNKISEKDSPDAVFNCFPVNLDLIQSAEKRIFPYKEIIVVDERPDTSKFGYWYSKKEPRGVKLCIKSGFQKSVSSFINSYLKDNLNPSGNSILACIKKCWTNSDDYEYRTISLKIEFYIQAESCYYALYRFDQEFTGNKNEYSEPTESLEKAIIASISKLYQSKSITTDMKCLSFGQIDSFNNQYKMLPVLKEKFAKKGVYMNFTQFKNNQPAYTEFETSLDERADALFVRGKNLKDSAVTDAWGFSDGDNMYVRIKMNFFPLFRHGNTFDLYGFDSITESRVFNSVPPPYYGNSSMSALDVGIQGLLGMIKSKSKNLKPYQVNMETGQLD
jgi:hypothetical protein